VFCPLEKLELMTETCPARSCMYKGVGGSCHYTQLTTDGVAIKDIAEVRQLKPYKVAAQATTARQAVVIGTILIQYANYIKDSFPERQLDNKAKEHPVNNQDDKHVRRILTSVFELSPRQQSHFWEQDRLTKWAARMNVTMTSQDIRTALLSATANDVSR
jgi:hypothetical protein